MLYDTLNTSFTTIESLQLQAKLEREKRIKNSAVFHAGNNENGIMFVTVSAIKEDCNLPTANWREARVRIIRYDESGRKSLYAGKIRARINGDNAQVQIVSFRHAGDKTYLAHFGGKYITAMFKERFGYDDTRKARYKAIIAGFQNQGNTETFESALDSYDFDDESAES